MKTNLSVKPEIKTVWDEIKGKAGFYKTARITAGGDYAFVNLLGHNGDGTFRVRKMDGTIEFYACNDLCDYCL